MNFEFLKKTKILEENGGVFLVRIMILLTIKKLKKNHIYEGMKENPGKH